MQSTLECFWEWGYEATSVRDLAVRIGITNASLYDAFGDQRSLFLSAFDHYTETNVRDRIKRFETLAPLDAIQAFFAEIVDRSIEDESRRGCMLVNSALKVAPLDFEFQSAISDVFSQVEAFFSRCVAAGQRQGTITCAQSAEDLDRMLLGVLLGIRVLDRSRPKRALLEGLVRSVFAFVNARSALAPEPLP